MDIIKTDVAIVGAGGGGLRAAIAIAEMNPSLDIALISKVYPMRSHTVAAEGGAAGVVREDDSLENHFNDTVSGGDWLCEQDVVDYFVENCTKEGFLFGCKYMTIFSKRLQKLMKIKENEMQTFALLHKVCGSTISGGVEAKCLIFRKIKAKV